MASTRSISVSPFPPARRSAWPRCRLGPALRSTSSSRLEVTQEVDLMRYAFQIVGVFRSAPLAASAQDSSQDHGCDTNQEGIHHDFASSVCTDDSGGSVHRGRDSLRKIHRNGPSRSEEHMSELQ